NLVHLVYLVYLVCLVDRTGGGLPGLSCLSRLPGWSDRNPHQKNQIDQKDHLTRQTSPRAFREQEDDQAAPLPV
ncbi:MAG: hypothetical protein Q8S75_19045, partial [Nitrospirota bacterium]|nr:hypothetical protein [Nitrospirota bacterium]